MVKRRSIGRIKKEVENFKKSNLSKRDYCQTNGISLNSLNWILIRLKRHEKSKDEKSRIELPENFSEQSFEKIWNQRSMLGR